MLVTTLLQMLFLSATPAHACDMHHSRNPQGQVASAGAKDQAADVADTSDAIVLTPAHSDRFAQAMTAKLKIHGILCSSCSRKIRSKLESLNGVRAVKLFPKAETAEVVFAAGSKTSPQDMVEAVNSLGDYKASLLPIN
jgi:copper chaperone CopZ